MNKDICKVIIFSVIKVIFYLIVNEGVIAISVSELKDLRKAFEARLSFKSYYKYSTVTLH